MCPTHCLAGCIGVCPSEMRRTLAAWQLPPEMRVGYSGKISQVAAFVLERWCSHGQAGLFLHHLLALPMHARGVK